VRPFPARWRGRELLLDTNLLLLYIVGSIDLKLIGRHKRTDQFIPEDYKVLKELLRRFPRIVTTPNILTEVSNLLDQIGERTAQALQSVLAALIKAEKLDERYVRSLDAITIREFPRLGVTDSSVIFMAQKKSLILTEDVHLYRALLQRGVEALNFNHIRELGWR
jgi:rRNA-processing protein FCF1